ncbi:MAG TPA: hypothetical protein VGO80_21255 [Solirubrobacteraceae bacterium]|jgi:hypothetical protein|nr:hypothetical protein [Solirubrobacteraceae bacterium]
MTPGADRGAYEARQAELLRALLRGDQFPGGFDVVKAGAAGRSLRLKRARALAGAWPALAIALGDGFAARFDAFARETPPPAFGFGTTDGLSFARTLSSDELTDDVRVELLLARALVVGRGAAAMRARRGIFAGAVALHEPRRILIVLRLPRLGRRGLVVPLARAR